MGVCVRILLLPNLLYNRNKGEISLKASLLQEQSLRLAMTQELMQAITMLQYNVQELSEFLYEQSLENPLIELGGFEREKKKSSTQVKVPANKSRIRWRSTVWILQRFSNIY